MCTPLFVFTIHVLEQSKWVMVQAQMLPTFIRAAINSPMPQTFFHATGMCAPCAHVLTHTHMFVTSASLSLLNALYLLNALLYLLNAPAGLMYAASNRKGRVAIKGGGACRGCCACVSHTAEWPRTRSMCTSPAPVDTAAS